MFKLPYKNNVRQQVEFLQKADKNRHDLGEALFGYTGENNLKGRVQISHAFMEGTVEDSKLIEKEGILEHLRLPTILCILNRAIHHTKLTMMNQVSQEESCIESTLMEHPPICYKETIQIRIQQ